VVLSVFLAIQDIDTQLFHLAHLLDRAQPSSDGKLSVRFRRARARTADGQTPVFVRWYRAPNTSGWHAKVLPLENILRQAKVDGLFRATHAHVPPLLRDARSLMIRRASLLKIVDLAQRTMALNVGLARKQTAAIEQQYKVREPKIEAAREQALAAYHSEMGAKAARRVQARS
jgi:DNA-binding XRE family transcriptional regulator